MHEALKTPVVAQSEDLAGRPRTIDDDWLIAADPDDQGRAAHWQSNVAQAVIAASVPGTLQESLPGYHGLVWYWRQLPDFGTLADDERYELRFEGVSYAATVWLDGHLLGGHAGDGPFSFDVTDLLAQGSGHLLAVRVLNPTRQRIDGIVLDETPHGNAALDDDFWPGRGYNYGGISGSVQIRRRGAVEIVDVVARPDLGTGRVEISFEVENLTEDVRSVTVEMMLSCATTSLESSTTMKVDAPTGRSDWAAATEVDQVRPWSPDNPFCYELHVLLRYGRHTQSCRRRIGFRDFRVGADGTFRLNGKRCYLRSTHTGNHTPQGIGADRKAALIRRDLVNAKATGLNMVRFISGPATSEQLDLCDELGLMVYEETRAAWLLEPSPQASDRFDDELRALIQRDRNHPSVVIWGLLNETGPGPVFDHSVQALGLVRDLDPTRLVLLGSGRWDGDLSVGSVANPFEREWQPLWGEEGPSGGRVGPPVRGYVESVGDRHYYPTVPQDAEADQRLRSMGPKPIFLSEYGIGSMFDVVTELRAMEQAGAAMETAEPVLMRRMLQGYLADWERFNLADLYAFPEDLLWESQLRHSEHRARGLDLIRANPAIVGHNITGMLDHAVTGEGIWRFDRRWKPGVIEAISEGLAPARWCIFVSPRHAYQGVPARIEIILANDSAVPPGDYTATVRVMGAVDWQEAIRFSVSETDPYAIPVFDRTLPAASTGEYNVAISIDGAAAPTGGRLSFWRGEVPRLEHPITIDWLGFGSDAVDWLRDHDVHVFEGISGQRSVLVGPGAREDASWADLPVAVRSGVRAAVLSPHSNEAALQALFGAKVTVEPCDEWLYHGESIGFDHPLFTGLPTHGVLDWYFYDQTLPHHVLKGNPTSHAAVSLCVGNPGPGGYRSGLVAAEWTVARGSVLSTTLRIIENAAQNPAAGSLLLNVVRWLDS